MILDSILEFNQNYEEKYFYWTESSLYAFLCRYYMSRDVLLETISGMIIIRKYNVVGHKEGDKYITVYESVGEMNNVKYRIYLNTIRSVIAL